MKERCLEMNGGSPFGAPIRVKGLLAENVRLRKLCAEAKELAISHKLALREGDHRIKNSLQIVLSTMGAQGARATDPAVRSALQVAASRIQAVARIHDALQLSGGAVNLGALVQSMCDSLHAMAGDPDRVKVVVKVDAIEAPIALAQPIMLAVNELVVNALRHAFPGDRSGTVFVSLDLIDGELCAVVADDGIGLPAGHARSGGFGTKLVHMMAAKIGGKLRMESTNGARFTLSAPYATPH